MRAIARALGCALLLLSGFAAAAHAADQGRLLGTVVGAGGLSGRRHGRSGRAA